MIHSAAILNLPEQLDGVEQLAHALRSSVRTGTLRRGQRLPTMKEVADSTGLTYSAVNRAFAILQSEGLFVSRRRAGTFVAEPESAKGPEGGFSKVFALIAPELGTGFYASLQNGLDFASSRLGYQILTTNTQNDVRAQAEAITRLIDRGASGVALVPGTMGPSAEHHVRLLQNTGIPVVLLHRPVQGVQAPLIVIPFRRAGELAAERILAMGHRRIAFCASQPVLATFAYYEGMERRMKGAGVTFDPAHALYGQMKLFDLENYGSFERDIEAWIKRVMAMPNRPTAVFCTIDLVAEMVYLQALRCGLRVPEDLSIVSIGNKERAGAILHRLACVTLDERRVGERAADLLYQMASGVRDIRSTDVYAVDLDFDQAESLGSPATAVCS